jgi:hypothetical protein
VRVRELPRLDHTVEVETPSGRFYRWAADDPRAENRPSGLRHSSTMPGGFESLDCVLPRDPARPYPDVERLSTIRVRDAAGSIVGEFRLERAPRVSGDRMAISPSAVGWQAHLDDDKSASVVYVDRDLARWNAPSRGRELALASTRRLDNGDSGARADENSGLPGLVLHLTRLAGGLPTTAELWLDAGSGNRIASVYYEFAATSGGAAETDLANWDWGLASSAVDDAIDGTTEVFAASSGSGTFTPGAAARYIAAFIYRAATELDGDWRFSLRPLAMYGNHGLTLRGDAPSGLYSSDIEAHAVATWAPRLKFTEGIHGTIQQSAFVIPHAAHHDPTTAAEIIKQATRFELRDWAVWEGPTYYSNERGARGRRWRARVGPAQLEETGPQVDRLWESIIVQYRDVDGTTRTVGPPGSGADTESEHLKDADPQNPANKLGIVRRELLAMGTGTAGSATEIGRRFLEETKLIDRSGRARLVGHVEDDRGVVHPTSHVRAGDTVEFVDADDTSARRIVKADHDHDQRAVSVDLDAPPEGLQATLERLGVVIAPLGI